MAGSCRTWWAGAAEAAGLRPGSAVVAHALHLPRLRDRRPPLRQGRRLCAPGHAGQAPEGQPPRRAAARRRRHLAGLGHGAVDQRQDMVDACKLLGVDVMTGHWEFTYGMERVKEIVEKDFRAGSTSSRRTSRPPTFGDPVFSALRHERPSTACRWPSSPGLPVHADRQPALHGGRLDLRHPGRQPAEVVDEARGQRARRWWWCCRTTAWTST